MPVRPLDDRAVYRYALLYDAPGFVKEAAVSELLGPQEQDAELFADQAARQYSIHTKAATWMATAHFLENAGELNPRQRELVESRLEAAARHHRIESEVGQLRTKFADHQQIDPDSLPDRFYGWVVKQAAGQPAQRHLRLLNADEIKTAAAWLVEHRDRFVWDDRMKIARRILARADEARATLDGSGDDLDKMAAYGDNPLSVVLAAVTKRASLLRPRSAEAAGTLDKLAETLLEHPGHLRDRDRRVKLAGIIDRIDRDYSLINEYDHGVARPEDALFGFTEKVAREYLERYVELADGSLYEKAAIEQISLHDLKEKVGAELADACSDDGLTVDAEKTAAALREAGPAAAALFRAAAGLQPAMKAAQAHPRITREDLIKLAEQAE